MAKVYIVDEEVMFANLIASAATFAGHEPQLYHDATSAYMDFINSDLKSSKDIFWVDMYLLPGVDPNFEVVQQRFDEYRVGLRLAELIVSEQIIDPANMKNLILYTGHVTSSLWDEIEKFCREKGTRSFQKRADTSFDDLVNLMR